MTGKTLADILIREFAEVAPYALLSKAAELLEQNSKLSGISTLARARNTGEVMAREFLALPPQTSAAEALQLMEQHHASCLVVVSDVATRMPVGMFSESDTLRLFSDGQQLENTLLSEAMTPLATTIRPELPLQDALLHMQRYLICNLVVVDNEGRAHGLLTAHDVVRMLDDARLEHLEHFDPLTQLPNRALLEDRLHQALAVTRRSGSQLAVCHLDLDNFRTINETYGKSIGDTLLGEVGSRIKNSLRGGDTVARIGGDEFVLLLGEIENASELDQTLTRILGTVAAPYTASGHQLQVSASMGVTVAPTDSSDSDTLLRHADQAMYAAKQEGCNRYHLFDVAKDNEARKQRDTQVRISQALDQGEFLLHYQPKVNMRVGKVTGFEALIRWQHPERGLLAPQEFLPQTAGHQSDIAIGEWVMGEALRQACRWAQVGLTLPISVNISAHHLQQPDFVSRLADLLSRMKAEYPDVQPGWLELEILETAALGDMAAVSKVIDTCHDLGVGFALDDFGTGYSSLTYLKRLQANTLKIDQSFVRDMLENSDDLAIVEGVVGLTSAFRRKVIAEGVESILHGMMLMHLGCDLAQGFGIARPMPAADVPLWVASFQPPPAWSESLSYPWSREDFPLLAVEFEHKEWVERLLALLQSPDKPNLEDAFFDPTHCRFGTWYQEHGLTKFGHMTEFTAIGQLHEHVYRLGKRIIQLHLGHKAQLAEALIPHLHAANEDLFEGLGELRREMAQQAQTPPTHWSQIRSA